MVLDLGDADGFAMRISEANRPRTQVIVVGQRWPVERRQFTLAHELAHLLAPGGPEKTAHQFAGALLLPISVVQERFPTADHMTMKAFVDLKEEYGLSLQAIASRCKDAGLIDEQRLTEHFRSFNNSASVFARASLEKFAESPARYDELKRKAWALGLID